MSYVGTAHKQGYNAYEAIIDIREAHGKTDLYLFFIFFDTVSFIADIARRLFDFHQYLI